jgi:hypothetical protein
MISLVLNTIKDVREKLIDERRNWFILGAVIMMYAIVYVPYRLLAVFTIPFIITYLFKKAGLASGDINALVYLSLGYYFFGLRALLTFILVVLFGHLAVGSVIRGVFKIKDKYPFMPVILGSHITMGLIYFFNLA